MRILDQVKTSSMSVVDAGRGRVDDFRRDRRRQSMLTELGRHCYAHRSGTGVGDEGAEIERIVAEITALDDATLETDTDSFEPGEARVLESA